MEPGAIEWARTHHTSSGQMAIVACLSCMGVLWACGGTSLGRLLELVDGRAEGEAPASAPERARRGEKQAEMAVPDLITCEKLMLPHGFVRFLCM